MLPSCQLQFRKLFLSNYHRGLIKPLQSAVTSYPACFAPEAFKWKCHGSLLLNPLVHLAWFSMPAAQDYGTCSIIARAPVTDHEYTCTYGWRELVSEV